MSRSTVRFPQFPVRCTQGKRYSLLYYLCVAYNLIGSFIPCNVLVTRFYIYIFCAYCGYYAMPLLGNLMDGTSCVLNIFRVAIVIIIF
jgi:hypothetical protein